MLAAEKKKFWNYYLRPISSPNVGGRPGRCSHSRAAFC
jgi:hypothetical protein